MYTLTDEQIGIVGVAMQVMEVTAIEDNAQCERINEQRTLLNKTKIAIEKERKEAKKPYIDAGKQIDAVAKLALDPLAAAISRLDRIRKDYMARVDMGRAAAVAEQALNEHAACAAAEGTEFPPDLTAVKVDKPAPAPVPTRKVKVVEIIDRNAVPPEYWVIDEVSVRRDALAGVVIPGVIVREEERPA